MKGHGCDPDQTDETMAMVMVQSHGERPVRLRAKIPPCLGAYISKERLSQKVLDQNNDKMISAKICAGRKANIKRC